MAGAKGSYPRITGLDPDLELKMLRVENAELRQQVQGLKMVCELLRRRTMRFLIALLDSYKDQDFSDPTQPVHTIGGQHIVSLQKQGVGIQVVQKPKSHDLEVFMWTGKAGEDAARAREKFSDENPPESPLEVLLPASLDDPKAAH
jgi:hypothetical protein